jgi:NADH-quinone oxidoreductase subunit G
MLEAAAAGELDALLLIGCDPVRDFEDPEVARRAVERVGTLVVADILASESSHYADVILPACAPQERVGSFTTWEGRRQPFPQAVAPSGLCLEDWDIVRQLARVLGSDLGWETANDVRREAAPLMEAAVAGGQLHVSPGQPVAAQPREEGELDTVVVPLLLGRGAMLAGAKDLLATARPPAVLLNPSDAGGLAEGQTVTVAGPGGEVALPVRITSGVVPGCAVLPGGAEPPVAELAAGTPAGVPLRIRLRPAGAA